MKLITKNTKSFLLLMMICYFHLICIANTTKRYSLKVYSKHSRKTNLVTEKRKTKNSRKTNKSKSLITRRRHTKSANFKNNTIRAKWNLFSRVKDLIALVIRGTKRIFTKIVEEVKENVSHLVSLVDKLFHPLCYIIKWVWEKTKTLLSTWKDVDLAISRVGMFLNNPITYLFKYFYQKVKQIQTEEDVNKVITNEYWETKYNSLNRVNEKGLTNLKEKVKKVEATTDKHKNKKEFVKGIYMGFMRSILNEINPVSLASAELTNPTLVSYLEESKSGLPEKVQDQAKSILKVMEMSVVDSALAACSQQSGVQNSISAFINTVMEIIDKYKNFFRDLVITLKGGAYDMGKYGVRNRKNLGVFQAISIFAKDMKNILSTLIKSFTTTFFLCVDQFATEIVEYIFKKLKLEDVIVGSLTIVTQILDDAVNSLPIWYQIRGIFDTFLSIYSVIKAPLDEATSFVLPFKESQAGLSVKIGAYLANFVIRGVDAGLALANVQGLKTIIKASISGFLVLYKLVRNKIAEKRLEKKKKLNKRFRFYETSSSEPGEEWDLDNPPESVNTIVDVDKDVQSDSEETKMQFNKDKHIFKDIESHKENNLKVIFTSMKDKNNLLPDEAPVGGVNKPEEEEDEEIPDEDPGLADAMKNLVPLSSHIQKMQDVKDRTRIDPESYYSSKRIDLKTSTLILDEELTKEDNFDTVIEKVLVKGQTIVEVSLDKEDISDL